MPRPSVQGLSAPLRALAREIAERLARRGARVWIVGGAVRDLVLARPIQDVDLASAATPDVVEAEFERTIPLGRAFGTLVIHLRGMDAEHTTFRTEDRYEDARRPEAVLFGSTPEEDATRRDFRCNALYLDPLNDELRDPTGGLADLEARRIACVGDPMRRFSEDGLRIVRLARFAGQLGLEPTTSTLDAARGCLPALRGVSPERLRVELEHLFERGGLVPAFDLLDSTGALARVQPHLSHPSRIERMREVFRQLGARPGVALGFAAWFDPTLEETPDREGALLALKGLRPSREIQDQVRETWRIADEIADLGPAPRSRRVRWMRQRAFESALALAGARAAASGRPTGRIESLRAERAVLGASDLRPAPLLGADDLLARGLAPGPCFAVLLGEAETLQLDGAFADRAAALTWLERRVQEGGNDFRKA